MIATSIQAMDFLRPTPDAPLHPHIAGKLAYGIPLGHAFGDQGRFNAWCYDVTLVHDRHRSIFALLATVSEDPDDGPGGDPGEREEPFHLLVMTDPLVDDDDWIAWRLVEEYGTLPRPPLSFHAATDALDLGRGEQLNWQLGLHLWQP